MRNISTKISTKVSTAINNSTAVNLVVNGTFDSVDGWTFAGSDWNIDSGVAYVNTAYRTIYNDYEIESGKTYLLEFDCVSVSGARFYWVGDSAYRLANGKYSAEISPISTEQLALRADNSLGTPAGADYIDNVRLIEL